MIAFFGTGLMGTGFIRAFLERGEQVNVWNRTAARAKPLEAEGARVFTDPAEAAQGASRIHLSLSDDASVDNVLEDAYPGMQHGTIVVDHTTTSPSGTIARYKRWRDRGIIYQHAPVFMGPQNAREHTGLMLVSGPRDIIRMLRPELEKMTGKVLDLGERVDKAAAFKLFGNMMIVFIVSGIADVYTFAKSLGIEPSDAHTLFEHFKPGAQIELRGKRMAAGDFAPAFELAMARKDVRLMAEEAALHGVRLDVLPAIAERFDEMIDAGFGGEDIGVLAQASVAKAPV